MSEQQDGGPAFPAEYVEHPPGAVGNQVAIMARGSGMTLRDWFAGQALAGLLACSVMRDGLTEESYAALSYAAADAMLKARKP